MNKQPELTAQTRQNLMDAFWQIYTVKRIETITVKEIAAKAGYHRGTFYEYFTDVYQILDEIENSIIPTVEELPAFPMPSGDYFGVPLENFIELYEKHSKYYCVLLGENGDPAFASKLKSQIKTSLLSFFERFLKSSIELDYMLEYVLSAMVGVMSYWFRQNQNISKMQLMQLIRSLSEQGCIHSAISKKAAIRF